MKRSRKNYKRIVVKIGSSLFYKGKKLNELQLLDVVANIGELINRQGKEIILVSSGAIALGMEFMRMKARPKELSSLQAVAAIGQNILMDHYGNFFKNFGLTAAQLLLTRDDFNNRQRYLNTKNTLSTLLKLRVVPVINENDTVATEEIKFGDNDRLSALVAELIGADLLIMLSDVDGLLDKKKRLIKVVKKITPRIKELACPSSRKVCVGGMITKIEAAKIAVNSGIPCVITKGSKGRHIFEIVNDPRSAGDWTLFLPKR